MTGRENLEMVARLFGHDRRAARAAAAARARAARPRPTPPTGWCAPTPAACAAGSTSAPAWSARPRLLLLDEPTTGLDPRSRIELWDAIRGLVAGGTDVLLTTQYLDEADQLAEPDRHHRPRPRHRRRARPTSSSAGPAATSSRCTRAAGDDLAAVADGARRGSPTASAQIDEATRPRHASASTRGTERPDARRCASVEAAGVDDRRHRPAPAHPRRGVPRPHRPAARRRPPTKDAPDTTVDHRHAHHRPQPATERRSRCRAALIDRAARACCASSARRS